MARRGEILSIQIGRLWRTQSFPSGHQGILAWELWVNHYREHELPDIFFKDEPDRISDDESSSARLRRLVQEHIGWHMFRHTFGTILNANGENPKVIQELLRHATLKVTMGTYVQAVSDEKRNAQSKVVKMLLPGIRRAVS